jgi:hypothetical protein
MTRIQRPRNPPDRSAERLLKVDDLNVGRVSLPTEPPNYTFEPTRRARRAA